MIQEHLDAQEHIWTSGTILDRTTSSNVAQSARSMALQALPDTLHKMHSSTKLEQPSGIPPMWAPIPKNLNSNN